MKYLNVKSSHSAIILNLVFVSWNYEASPKSTQYATLRFLVCDSRGSSARSWLVCGTYVIWYLHHQC